MKFQRKPFRIISIVIITLISFTGCKQANNQENKSKETTPPLSVYQTRDSLVFKKIMAQAEAGKWAAQKTGKIIEKAGRQFLGDPYKAHTLEVGNEEKIVVNLHAFDCTTFLESTIALTMTIKDNYGNFTDFVRHLERLRYRDGELNGYLSRLHYFSDWIYDNQELNIINDITARLNGQAYSFQVNFMSKHPNYYKRLSGDGMIQLIKKQEKSISSRNYAIIPENNIHNAMNKMQTGDIVGFVTSKKGLDIAHVGLITKSGEQAYFMHASTDAGEVVESKKNLMEYVKAIGHMTGIVVARITK